MYQNDGALGSAMIDERDGASSFDGFPLSMTMSPGFGSIGQGLPPMQVSHFSLDAPMETPLFDHQTGPSPLTSGGDPVSSMHYDDVYDDSGLFQSTEMFPSGLQPAEETPFFDSVTLARPPESSGPTSVGLFGSGNTSGSTSDGSGGADMTAADPVDEIAGEWPRKLDFKEERTADTTDYEEFNDDIDIDQSSDDIIADDDSLLGDRALSTDSLMFMDPSVIPSPSTNSPPSGGDEVQSPTESIVIGGKMCRVSVDTSRALVAEFRALLLDSRKKYDCPPPRSAKSLGFKYSQTREILTQFYKERISRCSSPTQIFTAYSMLRAEFNEEKNAGILVLVYNVNSLDEAHMREIASIVDSEVRDWLSCDMLAKVLYGMVKHGRLTPQNILEWMDSGSVWRQRCCCISFTKLIHLPGTKLTDTVISLVTTCLKSASVNPLQTAAGMLLRELSTVDEPLTIATIRANLQRMSASCFHTATEKLNEVSKKELTALRSSAQPAVAAPAPEEISLTASSRPLSASCSSLPLPTLSTSAAAAVVPVRAPVSPGPKKKRQTKSKAPITPPPSSPDILKPIPQQVVRRTSSSGIRLTSDMFGGSSSMFGAASAVLGGQIARPPSTPQHQSAAVRAHHETPSHSVSPSPASTPTRRRTKPYTSSISPALFKQHPTSATLAAAVTASAANLDRCAPPLTDHMFNGSGASASTVSANNAGASSNFNRAALLFHSRASNVIPSTGGAQFMGGHQPLSPAKTQPVQMINNQRRQVAYQRQFVPPRGMSPNRAFQPGPRSMSTPPYQMYRQQPYKRK